MSRATKQIIFDLSFATIWIVCWLAGMNLDTWLGALPDEKPPVMQSMTFQSGAACVWKQGEFVNCYCPSTVIGQ
ncbi:MAG TPA: hypothetical protein VFP95_07205 [Gammaproteobacteria bacterium]|nr:hypothetical protein [Gammaproteobacteria bacterium]